MSLAQEQTTVPIGRRLVPLASSLGAPIARVLTGAGGRVLMYHRFGPGDDRRVDPRAFERHLEYIVRHFRVCTLKDLAEGVRQGQPLPRNAVAVTIDDGYADFLEYAYPALQRFEVPATLYVVTRFLDGDFWLWFDAAHYLLHAATVQRIQLKFPGRRVRLDLGSAASRQAAWSTFGDHCLRLGPSEQRAALLQLEEAVQVALPARPTAAYRAVTWDQARAFDPQLVEVGSHTCTHPVLSRCTDDEIAQEVVASRRRLAAELRRIPDAFCYPNGQQEDYDARCLRAVRRAGYTSATVAHGGTIGPGADPYALERMAAPAGAADFRRAVDGVTQLADQWRAWRPGKTS